MIDYHPPTVKPQIIYSDADLLVVDKPAELLSVPGRRPEHQDSLLTRLQQQHPEVLIVHRLDMSTSGLLVLARNRETHRELSRKFEQRQVKKAYLAVVDGEVKPPTGNIDLPLICDWPNRPRQMVDHSQGKPAHTEYHVQSYDPESNSCRVELLPTTGRTHQLRVHMLALGHPILGDDLYGDSTTLGKADRLLLHASSLEFCHPTTGKLLNFTSEAPF